MKFPAGIILLLMMVGLLAPSAAPARGAAEDASDPVTQSHDQWMREQVAALDARDPRERDRARRALMRLKRDDLPALRSATGAAERLSPEQRTSLADVVTHIYIATADLPRTPMGFLGVQLGRVLEEFEFREPEDGQGALVVSRMPGFVAYEVLEDGDLIVGIAGTIDVAITSGRDLQMHIGGRRAGEPLTLIVRRAAEQLRIPLRLSARPEAADMELQNELNRLSSEAEQFFERWIAQPTAHSGSDR
ncbi:MAG TPA: hypothetical protein PKB10_01410 [Tepidisphaeraceae bacterium]|nr:hypothetical protein [Tepidisphaeraceae bacterium]